MHGFIKLVLLETKPSKFPVVFLAVPLNPSWANWRQQVATDPPG